MKTDDDLKTYNQQALTAALEHMQSFAWPTVLLTLLLAASFLFTLVLLAGDTIPLWLGCVLTGLLSYMAYTPLHEAVHGNINGPHTGLRWLNAFCGFIAGQLILLPYSTHRPEHMAHHRSTNHPENDPDYLVHTMGDGPLAFADVVRRFIWRQWSYFPVHRWSSASVAERCVYVLEIVLAVGWRAAFISQMHWFDAVMVFVVSYLVAGGMLAYWFAYRPHHPYKEQARYRNTNSLIMPVWLKPLEWLWMGQNLHSIHHLFPRVPFYRYHQLHREIEPALRAHGTPILGIFSRRPMAADDAQAQSAAVQEVPGGA